jgi:hypothetical protein
MEGEAAFSGWEEGLPRELIMGQFGGVWAGRVIQGSGMSGAP